MNNKELILKAILYLVIIWFAYKLLQKIGVFKDADDKGADKLLDKSATDTGLTTELIKKAQAKKQPILTGQQAINIAKGIYNAEGIIDNDEQALMYLKKAKNKIQFAQVEFVFQEMYKKDLILFLDHFNASTMKIMNDYINSLK